MSTLKTNSITHISNSGTANLSLDSSGNVGIGTASPNSFTNYTTLTINGGSDGAGIDLELSDNNIYGRLFGDTSGLQIQSAQSGDAIRFETNGSNERMRIASDGKVGIGTTSPGAALDFGVTSTGQNVIHLRKNSNSIIGLGIGSNYGIRVFAPSDAGASNVLFETGTISTSDGTTFAQKGLSVLGDGKVGIGIASPVRLLTIYGDTGIALQNSTTGTGTGNGTHIWGSGNDLLLQNREAGNIRFFTSDQEKMELQADGDLKLEDGNLIINTSGHGVLFHSHAAANNLEDYEEGTFTPVVTGNGGTPGTWSTNNHAGTYRKIGKLCFIAMQVSGVVSAAGNGYLQITGLPFTAAGATGGHGQALALGPLFNWDVHGDAYQIGARVNDNGTTVMFWNNFDNASDTMLNWPFGNSGTKYGSIAGCYACT